MKKAATITQQTLDYVTMFRYVFNHLLSELILNSYANLYRSLEMDKVEQAEYQTIEIRKPMESKRDYHCRIFAGHHRRDLSKSDTYILLVIRLTITI
jgi:hypothetical protein